MLYVVVRMAVIVLCCIAAGLSAVNVLQAQRYQIPILRRDLLDYIEQLLIPNAIVGILTAVLNWYLPMLLSMGIREESRRENFCAWIVLVGFVLATALVWFTKRRHIQQKKPLVFTHRICRLLAVMAVLVVLLALIVLLLIASRKARLEKQLRAAERLRKREQNKAKGKGRE